MADPNTRQGKRTPVTLKIKFKSETLEQFIERYAVDVSQGGIFIRTKEPLAVGTQMKFEFQLRDSSPLIAGEGTVVWTRENDPSRPAIAPGMGVRFDRLGDGSQGVLEKILAEKAKQAPQRSGSEPTKPPMFTDSPTRVAPVPVQEALLGNKNNTRSRADSQETPLPKPMPFHSDADEFGAEAFEEQTKVRALDELVAQTAAGSDEAAQAMADELQLRAPQGAMLPTAPHPQTPIDRDSAPTLPSPPEPSSRSGKLLDTSPSPRDEQPPVRTSSPALEPAQSQRTRLGVEPAKAPVKYEPTERVPMPRATATAAAAAAEPHTARQRPSSAPVVIAIVFAVAVAGSLFWYFALRQPEIEAIAKKPTPPTTITDVGSATTNTVKTGSGSAAVAMTGSGSAGSAGSAAVKVATVETEVAANVAKATVTVIGSDQTGPAPFKAQLEKGKAYKVAIDAPGYAKLELDVTGGADKVTAKLVAKPHLITVTSEPPGAMIYVDNGATGKRTPSDVELTPAQAARKLIHLQVRLAGYKPADQMLDTTTMKEEADKVTSTFESKLVVAPVVVYTPPPHTGSGTGSAGSASTGSGTPPETGSATTQPPEGSGATPTPDPKPTGGSGGSGDEPAPDWSKNK